jgi:hypothetical protein
LGTTSTDTPDVTPVERWAIFSIFPTFYKIIDNLKDDIHYCLGYETCSLT